MYVSLNYGEKQYNSHTTSYNYCRMNNELAQQDNVVQGSHSELGPQLILQRLKHNGIEGKALKPFAQLKNKRN